MAGKGERLPRDFRIGYRMYRPSFPRRRESRDRNMNGDG